MEYKCLCHPILNAHVDKYFEVKGHWWGNDEEKMKLVYEQNIDINIEMVFGNDLERYENEYNIK